MKTIRKTDVRPIKDLKDLLSKVVAYMVQKMLFMLSRMVKIIKV